MNRTYRIELSGFDLGQLLDGLVIRAEAWERTAECYRTGKSPMDFIVEEATDANEAEKIGQHYRSIISKIEKQMEGQS